MIYFYCVGINERGGLKVLENFIKLDNFFFYLDIRLKDILKKKQNCIYLKYDFLNRIKHLNSLKKKLNKNDHLIFINGVPPILKFNCKVTVLFQNANLFYKFYDINFLYWLFSKDFLRFLTFKYGKGNVNDWIVLSPLSKKILKNNLPSYSNIKVLNILSSYNQIKSEYVKKKYDFIYPASYLKHKNHNFLFNVLIKLSKENIFPSVVLTFSENEIKNSKFHYYKKKYNLKLINIYSDNTEEFLKIYDYCKCLIYVSKNETIGLPLIEALKKNISIIAPNVSYSKQFLDPDFFYYQNDCDSLINAIKSVLKTENQKNLVSKQIKDFGDFDLITFLNYIKI